VIISNIERSRTRRRERAARRITEREINGLAAFNVDVINYQHSESLAGLAGGKAERAVGYLVIAHLTGRAVAGGKVHCRSNRSISGSGDGDGREHADFIRAVVAR